METRRRPSRPGVSPFFPMVSADPDEKEAQVEPHPGMQKMSQALQAAGENVPTGSRAVQARVHEVHFHGVYVISVASRLLEMHPQTLRKYERFGLVNPSRTGGMLRLYSERDIARLRMIKELVETHGLNLAGVELALKLVDGLLGVRHMVGELLDDTDEAWRQVDQEFKALLELLHFPVSAAPEH